jgi:cytochrome c oxidase subunit 2
MSRSRKSRRKARKEASAGRSPWKVAGFAVAATLVVGLAVFLALNPLRAEKSQAPGGQQVLVNMAGFSPQRLTAQAGSDLTLTLVNPDSKFHTDGGGWHQFRVEALDLDVKIPPESRRTVTLRDLRTGSYVFYCDVCCGGKENPTMRGILEVTG